MKTRIKLNYAGKQSNEDEVKITEYVNKSLVGNTILFRENVYKFQEGRYIVINKQDLSITYAHRAADVISANESNETGIRTASKKTYPDK